MKKVISLFAFAVIFTGGSGSALLSSVYASTKTVIMKTGCPREPGTMKKAGGVMEFSLKHGQKGGCSSDRKARHSAPYWERSELRSKSFIKGKTYVFSVDVKFDPNTKSSNRTTFFQVHQYNKNGCKSCSPALMFKVNANGAINLSYLRARGGHGVASLGITRSQIAGKWTKFSVETGTKTGNNPVTVFVNGRKAFSGTVFISARGTVYLKTGLYRPGKRSGLPRDRVFIRNVTYRVQR